MRCPPNPNPDPKPKPNPNPNPHEVLSAVARALANLTYDEAFAGQAVAEGALPPLVAML